MAAFSSVGHLLLLLSAHCALALCSVSLVTAALPSKAGAPIKRSSHEGKRVRGVARPSARLAGATTADVSWKLLQDHVDFPGSTTCNGRWHRWYAGLQGKILSGKLPPRYLTSIIPMHKGLGDQLLAVVSCFLAAFVTKRALVLSPRDWGVFEPSVLDWRLPKDVPMKTKKQCWKDGCRRLQLTRRQGRGAAVMVHVANGGPSVNKSWVQFPSDIVEYFSALDNVTNLQVVTNGGVLTSAFADSRSRTRGILNRMGLRLPTAYGCILRFLFRPRESAIKLAAPYATHLLPQSNRSVCIHLRSPDDFQHHLYRLAFQRIERTILKCALRVTKQMPPGGSTTWLVIADAQVLKDYMRAWNRTTAKVVVTSFHPKHFAAGAGPRARTMVVAEWLLFSTCRYYLMPHSGFSKTSFGYNLASPTPFLFSRFGDNFAGACDLKRPSSLLDFRQWSGL